MPLDGRTRNDVAASDLFRDLDAEAIDQLCRHARVVSVPADEALVLFEDGDAPDCFYIVLEGGCEVLKRNDKANFVDVVASVRPGLCVGEMPLLREAPRSATVRARPGTRLVSFPIEAVREELQAGPRPPYLPLVLRLEARLVEIVTEMNERAIGLLEQRNAALAHRQQVSVFIIYLVSLLCAFMFVTQSLSSLAKSSTGTTVITLPTIALIVVILIRPIRELGLPWSAYGVTRARWRASVRDGVVLAVPAIALVTAAKAIVIAASPTHAELPLFDCIATLTVERGSVEAAMIQFVVFNLAYVAIVVPLQEFVARGLLQGLLERFIESERRTALAIVVSNLIFGAFHLYLSFTIAVGTVLLGIYLGWIYTRTRNLLGVWIAHAILGTWLLAVIRVQSILP